MTSLDDDNNCNWCLNIKQFEIKSHNEEYSDELKKKYWTFK